MNIKTHFYWRPQPNSLTVLSRSSEVCLARCVSFLALVSHGGVLVDSWGIWRHREPRCLVCRSPCRWPSSRTGLRPFQPRWRWRTRAKSPGTPPEIVQEPEGEKGEKEVGKGRGKEVQRTRKSFYAHFDCLNWKKNFPSINFPFLVLRSKLQYSIYAKNTELCYFCIRACVGGYIYIHIVESTLMKSLYVQKFLDTWTLHPYSMCHGHWKTISCQKKTSRRQPHLKSLLHWNANLFKYRLLLDKCLVKN